MRNCQMCHKDFSHTIRMKHDDTYDECNITDICPVCLYDMMIANREYDYKHEIRCNHGTSCANWFYDHEDDIKSLYCGVIEYSVSKLRLNIGDCEANIRVENQKIEKYNKKLKSLETHLDILRNT
jgi:hypothetical protein